LLGKEKEVQVIACNITAIAEKGTGVQNREVNRGTGELEVKRRTGEEESNSTAIAATVIENGTEQLRTNTEQVLKKEFPMVRTRYSPRDRNSRVPRTMSGTALT
jgi:hypothetical protein